MSISPVGNSDAYARYRQQAVDLLASTSQASTPAPATTTPSYVTPSDSSDDASSNSFATKIKADLTALFSSQNGKPHAHGAHGHMHHKAGADIVSSATDATTNSTDQAAATDPFDQALDQFANLAKSAAGIAETIA